MSETTAGFNPGRILAALDRIALGGVLLSPVLLLHAHGLAEVAIAIVDLCFLVRSAITRDWAWIWTPWLLVGWVWWAWMIICSLSNSVAGLAGGSVGPLIQAVVFVRFLIFVAALEHSVLRRHDPRQWLYWMIAASAAYIAAHAVFQFITGYNFYGEPGGSDGELTGPFGKPRAGPPFARILLPAIVPWVSAMLTRPGIRPVVLGWLVLIGGASVALLIGQRMPFLLTCLGLVVIGLLLPRLRWGVMAAGIALAALLIVSPIVAPKAHYRLVDKFSQQIEHFATSNYGQLYARATEIAVQNPITGLGYGGFGIGCSDPKYFRPTFDGSVADGGGLAGCWHHPHNFYLEALDNGGFPGLILFCSLVLAWLAALGRGLWRQPDPTRAALFAAALIQLWPIASTTGFTSMPVGGWSFLLLGWGLAAARWPNGPGDPI